jgi:hypothetical protein
LARKSKDSSVDSWAKFFFIRKSWPISIVFTNGPIYTIPIYQWRYEINWCSHTSFSWILRNALAASVSIAPCCTIIYYNSLYLSSWIEELNHSNYNGILIPSIESEIHTIMVAVKQRLSMPKYCPQYFLYKGFINGTVYGPPPVYIEIKQMAIK